jgi:hypothetical protein
MTGHALNSPNAPPVSTRAHLILCAVAERLKEGSHGLEPMNLGSRKATRRGATPEPDANRPVQASLRDARFLRSPPVGFKPTATFIASLCEAGIALTRKN